MEENPLVEAGRKYRKLQKTAELLARAADQHPGVAYEYGSSPVISSGNNPEELSESEAEAHLHLLSYCLSDRWNETQEYFMFDLRPEFEEWTEDLNAAEVEKEALQELENTYDELEQEITGLVKATEHILGKGSLEQTKVTLASQNSYIASD